MLNGKTGDEKGVGVRETWNTPHRGMMVMDHFGARRRKKYGADAKSGLAGKGGKSVR